jgi:hypothetical protein
VGADLQSFLQDLTADFCYKGVAACCTFDRSFDKGKMSIVAKVLDSLIAKEVFHITNTVFEGSIGLIHLFLPHKVYEKATREIHFEQILFGRFFGTMMVALAVISYGARKHLYVAKGLTV